MTTNSIAIGVAYKDQEIVSGSVDDTPIGATTPSTGAFTSITGTSLSATTVTASGNLVVKVSTVAATGSSNTDAAALSGGFNVVSAADGTKGVILAAPVAGTVVIVKNTVAAILKIYPNSGAAINGLTATTGSYNIAASTSTILVAQSATQWYSIPLLAS